MKSPSKVPTFKTKVTQSVDHRAFARVPCAAITDPAVNPMTLKVLSGYCMFTSKKGNITFVGQLRIAAEVGVGQSTVSRHVNRLYGLGYLAKARRPPGKWGTAQTHRVFWYPVKNKKQRELEIEDALDADKQDADAPPVPI
tara:strand:+ start:42 stop:464 length:423 start_codon:yes stop_codon:yes gene_type:complete